MIIAGTGHRPDKLGGYSYDAKKKLWRFLKPKIEDIKPEKIISGMAQGFDMALAYIALDLKMPLVAAVPCRDQESSWPMDSQDRYKFALSAASEVIFVSEKYTPYCMQKRNEWMVDHCDALIALYNGTPGGTENCIRYAQKKNRTIISLWDEWEKHQ